MVECVTGVDGLPLSFVNDIYSAKPGSLSAIVINSFFFPHEAFSKFVLKLVGLVKGVWNVTSNEQNTFCQE